MLRGGGTRDLCAAPQIGLEASRHSLLLWPLACREVTNLCLASPRSQLLWVCVLLFLHRSLGTSHTNPRGRGFLDLYIPKGGTVEISTFKDKSNSTSHPQPLATYTCTQDHLYRCTHTHTPMHTQICTHKHTHACAHVYTRACTHTPEKLESTEPAALCQSVAQCVFPHPQPPGLIGSYQRCPWFGRGRDPASEFFCPSPSAGREPPGPQTAFVHPVNAHWQPAARPVL